MILVCFLAGVFVGLGDFAPEWLLGHDLPIIILSLLIVQVGISLGSNNDLRGLFHSLNPRMSLLPVFTIGGTLLFSAIGVFLLHGRDLNDCLTIGSGFGYYSLSSVLIADIKSATLGPQGAAELATIALLANVIREMIDRFVRYTRSRSLGWEVGSYFGSGYQFDGRVPSHDRAKFV